ncbi:MAG: beta-ketoacyl-[acyl-carrier-protein] synthase family protein [Acidobacteriota bacterium]|nr:beta-ketoacyl-[acyl-carrier-protein] synthase family protein [Acidobacteriota bacterium]
MERVVITGVGVVTPIGIGAANLWDGLMRAEHGFAEVASFDTSAYKVHVGAEVKRFRVEDYLPDVDASTLGRATRFALAAGQMALDDAGHDLKTIDGTRAGVVMGTTSGEPNLIETFNDCKIAERLDDMGPALARRYPCHNIPATLAAHYGFSGCAPLMIPAACAAGNYAIAHAWERLHSGRVDMMLAGGSDAFSRITYTGFARLMAIAPDICRPFANNRKGMIPGEGAGVLVLETLSGARARGADIYAEITGYGFSCDAHHMTGGHPDGRGAVGAMRHALEISRTRVEEVDYISAHGTGTPSNDRNETTAVKNVFGDRAAQVPISSIKSMLGHTMGAASAIEAGVCAMVIRNGLIPPTANLDEPDPYCDLDYVPNEPRKHSVRVAMNNAYAFGGTNASLVIRALED